MSKKPDYKLKALNKKNNNRCDVGVAWNNEGGSISIVLNPCVVLTYNEDIVLTLFKNSDFVGYGKEDGSKKPNSERLKDQSDVPVEGAPF